MKKRKLEASPVGKTLSSGESKLEGTFKTNLANHSGNAQHKPKKDTAASISSSKTSPKITRARGITEASRTNLQKHFTPGKIAARTPAECLADTQILEATLALNLGSQFRDSGQYFHRVHNDRLVRAIYIIPSRELSDEDKDIQGQLLYQRLTTRYIPSRFSLPNILIKPANANQNADWIAANRFVGKNGKTIIEKTIPDDMPIGTLAIRGMTVQTMYHAEKIVSELLNPTQIQVDSVSSPQKSPGTTSSTSEEESNEPPRILLPKPHRRTPLLAPGLMAAASPPPLELSQPAARTFSPIPISPRLFMSAPATSASAPPSRFTSSLYPASTAQLGLFGVKNQHQGSQRLAALTAESRQLDVDVAARERSIAALRQRLQAAKARASQTLPAEEQESTVKRRRLD